MAPSSARHVVTGIFESGFHEYDVRLGLVNIDAAQRFLNRGKVVRWLEARSELQWERAAGGDVQHRGDVVEQIQLVPFIRYPGALEKAADR